MLVDCFVICVGASVFELVSNKCITSFEMAIKDIALRGSFYLANKRLSLSSPSGTYCKRFKFWRLASLLIEKDIEKDFLTGNSITHDEHRLDRALCLFGKHVHGYVKIVFAFFKAMVTINISYKSPSNKILEIKTILRNLSKNSMNKI